MSRLTQKIRRASTALGNLGLTSFTRYRLAKRRAPHLPANTTYTLTTPRARYPLNCRAHTSDIEVFIQIYAEHEYAPLDTLPRNTPGLIIDCGANVGYAAAYFLTRFPHAQLIAIEPAPDNYAALTQNLHPYGPRATTRQAALWSHNTTLNITTPAHPDGNEWSRQVTETQPNTTGNSKPQTVNASTPVPAYDIPTLLRESGHERITLLKIDIEGAETEVFSANTDWLSQVETLVIELHNKPPFPDAHPIVACALSAHPFTQSTSGELTIYKRVK